MPVAATTAPNPHVPKLDAALDRASSSVNRAYTTLQSIADGPGIGSTRLDDHLSSIGSHLIVASGHASRAGIVEAVPALANASAHASALAEQVGSRLPEGATGFRPRDAVNLIDSSPSTIRGFEQAIAGTRELASLPAGSPSVPPPTVAEPGEDLRLLAYLDTSAAGGGLPARMSGPVPQDVVARLDALGVPDGASAPPVAPSEPPEAAPPATAAAAAAPPEAPAAMA